jgi:hypothetical protein
MFLILSLFFCFPFSIFLFSPHSCKPNENGTIFAPLLKHNQGLTGFDSKDSGIVSMPGL